MKLDSLLDLISRWSRISVVEIDFLFFDQDD